MSEKREIILKTRDDKKPIRLELTDEKSEQYQLINGIRPSWIKKDEEVGPAQFRPRIEPWLTALFQSEHFSLLVGTGLTNAVRGVAGHTDQCVIPNPQFRNYQEQINKAAGISEDKSANNTATIERTIQVANELLIGLKHLYSNTNKEKQKEIKTLQEDISKFLKDFSRFILELEENILKSNNKEAFNYLVNFLTSFASRTGTRDRLQIFTTNYDRIIEAGADVAGLHLLDRFIGNLSPVFRSSRLDIDMHYNPPGMRGEPRYLEGVARFAKLHGSIDWIKSGQYIRRVGLPFGASNVEPYLKILDIEENDFNNLMIYPNAAKDKETTAYPYVEMFRDFSASICRPNNTLVTYGYGYGDDHINRIIKDMLTIPSTHLVIISYDDSKNQIMETYENVGKPAQITLLIGEDLAGLEPLVDNYLPKAAIDSITYRMADLLRSRLGTEKDDETSKDKNDNT